MMDTYITTKTMVHIECGGCGQLFAMTEAFHARKKEDHDNWYCPNGCIRHYPQDNEEEKLRKRLALAQEEVNREQWKVQEIRQDRDTARKQRNALRGHLGRAKRRAAAGTCPCCKRTFQALTTHMLKQHPEYVKKNRTKKR